MPSRVFRGFTAAEAAKYGTGTPKHCGRPMTKLVSEAIWECPCGAHVIGNLTPEEADRLAR